LDYTVERTGHRDKSVILRRLNPSEEPEADRTFGIERGSSIVVDAASRRWEPKRRSAFARAREVRDRSPLPEEPDRERAEQILMEITWRIWRDNAETG